MTLLWTTVILPRTTPLARRLPLLAGKTVTTRFLLTAAIQRRLDDLVQEHAEMLQRLSSESGMSAQDNARFGQILTPVANLHDQYQSLQQEQLAWQELMQQAKTAADKEECQAEMDDLKDQISKLEETIVTTILDRLGDGDDNNNSSNSNALIEVRAGTGGDEASLFAGELLEAYRQAAVGQGFGTDFLTKTSTDLGGIKEASMEVKGTPSYGDENNILPYSYFQWESGVHRVQRVPINDSKIHTSACSVAVLPLMETNSSNSIELLPLADLKIETMRSSGAGGQHVNTTDSAVRITHLPTGITASIQDERSQIKNKEKAMKLIAARVQDFHAQQVQRERGALRSSLLGGGDRSERIRTYNYPQDRVTDHRCNVTHKGIVKLFSSGSLVGLFGPPLQEMRRHELLQALDEQDAQEEEQQRQAK